MRKFLIILSTVLLLLGCTPQAKNENEKIEITISAASSLSESLVDIKEIFEKENPTITLSFNFGGSGTLRRQIEQGAPIDLFLSASKNDYQLLEEQDKFSMGTPILENQLVIISTKGSCVASFKEFVNNTDHQLAIGTPDAVPAGTYSRESLQAVGVWEQLEGRLVYTKDVQQVLTYVTNGAVDVGIVYLSDTIKQENIHIIGKVDPNTHSAIEYYIGMIDNDNASLAAKEKVYQFLQSQESLSIFESYGFLIHSALSAYN